MTRVAVVTGAGSGIGAASARALADAGYAVVLAGRTRETLDRVAADCGADCHVVVTDVSDADQVAALFREVSDRFGRLDVLFNNAGSGAPPVPMDELSLDAWDHVIGVNLSGAFYCTREAFRIMKAQEPRGGRIINNGSISAQVPRPYSAPYTASKHGMTGLTRSTALDGRAHNIACSQIDIGNALTDLTARMENGVPQADGSMKAEPTMDVAHVAEAVVHIANLPLSTSVPFMTIMASKMPYIGRG